MRRRTLLVALAGLAVVVVLWPPEDRITEANLGRIKEGMTQAEVEAILGPPGDYRTGHGETGIPVLGNGSTATMVWRPDPVLGNGSTATLVWTPDPATNLVRMLSENWGRIPDDQRLWASWLGDSIVIGIAVDESGSVVDKSGCPRRTTQGPLDNLLWRLNRQWHRWFP
jgi:hypothetical protein